jgi:predicted Rossmann fold nucleotide-binding protein DprA/Smf involved in DNA uptake
MAIGIDGVALAGALSSGGVTVAVIGSGIDVCYPEEHKRLAREIVKQGCVLTEYAPGTKPLGNNFPRRNRLVSGLCCATVVIEGKIRSGALITARCAKEQGRLLYALPGNVDVKTSEVTNLLIKSGAKLITDASDIITDLEARYTGLINPFSVAKDRTALDFDWLRRLEVSCVTPSDGIFTPSRNRGKKDSPGAQGTSAPNDKEEKAAFEPKPKLSLEELGLDGDMLKVYSKIPEGAECFAEDLPDAELDMKKIMRILLKLEMGRFIKLLPGGKVKRNI